LLIDSNQDSGLDEDGSENSSITTLEDADADEVKADVFENTNSAHLRNADSAHLQNADSAHLRNADSAHLRNAETVHLRTKRRTSLSLKLKALADKLSSFDE
jgi:hypothetical protein